MKTNDFLKEYKRLKSTFRQDIAKISFGKMISQNIESLLPEQWKMEPDGWKGDIRITPKGDTLTADQFDKLLTILSRNLRSEPTKRINANELYGYFNLYRGDPDRPGYVDWNISIRIEIKAGNTESCEIITETVTETVERTTLTGYCKAISEKRYFYA